jgi:cytochrome c peroxidase
MCRNLLFLLLFFVFLAFSSSLFAELSPKEELGKALFFDNISDPDWMSCATCHDPKAGWTGPIAGINLHGAVYRGAVPTRFGNRKPPSAAYATESPVFHYDDEEGLFVGGNFWDGRATGEDLGNPAADQALGPFLNPVEQNNASKLAVLEQIANSKYAMLWEEVWEAPPLSGDVETEYSRVGLSIAAYEASSEVNQFSSKYDYYLADEVELTEEETWGLDLFNDEEKGKCALCHISAPGPNDEPPLFTDFTFDNLGVPKNPENPFYEMDEELLNDGTPINPMGAEWIDPGLGGFLEMLADTDPAWYAMAEENMGKHKVPTLRNVGKGAGKGFQKAYMHNGVFKSLKEVVHFYNTRDVEDWPEPEVPDNVNTDELGDLGLTDEEEDAIVTFMLTLSDGYKLKVNKDMDVISMNLTPKTYALYQNIPNPFNPTTEIRFQIPNEEIVKLSIYNLLGQEIVTLLNKQMPAGEHRLTWNATDKLGNSLPNGIYVYQLTAGSFTDVRKMMLLK